MENKKISIITPVYGVEKIKSIFLKTVKSVLNQTYENFEYILVNDGSPDNTESVLSDLAKKDERIVVITKDNGGVESARREGLRNVSGDYVFHLDQDDLLDKNTLKYLYDAIEQNNADIAVGESARFYNFKFISKYLPYFNHDFVISHNEFMDEYYLGFFGVNRFPINIWNKLYRKSFLDSIEEPPLVKFYNEDLNYNIDVFPKAKSIAIVNKPLYYYRWGGFTNHKIKDLEKVGISCYAIKRKKIDEYNLEQSKYTYRYYISVELINQINSALYQEIVWDKINFDLFKNKFNEFLNYSEVKEAIDYLDEFKRKSAEEYNKYYLSGDVEGLYLYLSKRFQNEKKKRSLMNILG